MELIKIENQVPYINDLAACIGQFDGLHVAHQALINLTKEVAIAKHLKSAMITFDPHPDFVLNKSQDHQYLTPLQDKIALLEPFKLDYLIVIHFDMKVANSEKTVFVNDYLLKMGVKDIICGFDFRFSQYGKGRPSDIENLSKGLIQVHVVDEIKIDDEKVGSTLVKTLLQQGEIEKVNAILGRPYFVKGTVVKGSGIGHTYDIPTANLRIDGDFVDLKNGVYQVEVLVKDHKYAGIGNFGHNPSFNYQNQARLEVYLFDYYGNLYDEEMSVFFIKYLRAERKFNSELELKSQIQKDIKKITENN